MLTEQLAVDVVCRCVLVDQRFYHLDTCFVPLPDGRAIYYPPAFDEASPATDASPSCPETAASRSATRMPLASPATRFVGQHPDHEPRYPGTAQGIGRVGLPGRHDPADGVHQGGRGGQMPGAGSRPEDLPGDFRQRRPVESPIRSQLVELEGHLLDEGVMTHAFDAVNRSGSSFRMERFRAGERSDQTSLVRFGGQCPEPGPLGRPPSNGSVRTGRGLPKPRFQPPWLRWIKTASRRTTSAARRSIPPRYASNGSWVPVRHQRMDAAIVGRRTVPSRRRPDVRSCAICS